MEIKTPGLLYDFNPLVTNGHSHHYHLDDYIFIFWGEIRSDFSFLFYFPLKVKMENRIVQDGMLRFAASHLGLFICLCPIKRTPGLYGLIKRRLFTY